MYPRDDVENERVTLAVGVPPSRALSEMTAPIVKDLPKAEVPAVGPCFRGSPKTPKPALLRPVSNSD